MTSPIQAKLPVTSLRSWMAPDIQELLSGPLVPPQEAGENDPVALLVSGGFMTRGASNEPISEVLLGSSRRQRIIERPDDRSNLALAALALQSDAVLNAFLESADNLRNTDNMDEHQIYNVDMFVFPQVAVLIAEEDEGWNIQWEDEEEDALIEDYLPQCLQVLLPPNISNHTAVALEQQIHGALKILDSDILQATGAAAEPFSLSVPRLTTTP